MKILCASVFKDGTGYSHGAIEFALACEAGGLDVVCRSISLSPQKGVENAKGIAHLESKNVQGVDAVVQYCLPHTFEYKGGVKNIGMFAWETTHFRRSSWRHQCNMMDEVWVLCEQSRAACLASGVKVPIRVIPCSCDTKRCEDVAKPLNNKLFKDRTIFYAVGEHVRRKNMVGLLRAYYAAFSDRDNVVLLIKTSVPGMRPDQALSFFRAMCDDMKKSMHLYPDLANYPPVVIITDYVGEDMIKRIHETGHFFVLPSHGESWCVPAHDAMAFGNPVIAPAWGSFPDLMKANSGVDFDADKQRFACSGEVEGGYLVGGNLTPCFAPDAGFPDLYTGTERWFEPDLDELVDCLRAAHVARWEAGYAARRYAASERASVFSREKVGQIIRKALEG